MNDYPPQWPSLEPTPANKPPSISVPLWAQPQRSMTGGPAAGNPITGGPSVGSPFIGSPAPAAPTTQPPPWAWESPPSQPLPTEPAATNQSPTAPVPPWAQPRGRAIGGPVSPNTVPPLGSARAGMLVAAVLAFSIGVLLGARFVPGLLHQATGATATPTPVPLSEIVYTVTSVNGKTLVVVRPDGTPLIAHTSPDTSYQREGLSAAFTDISVGLRIKIRGQFQSDGSMAAARILIFDPSVSGTVASISASALTLSTKTGGSINVRLSSNTKIVDVKTHQPLELSSLKVGEKASVFGELKPDGAFDAVVVTV